MTAQLRRPARRREGRLIAFKAWIVALVVAFGVGGFGLTTLVIGWSEDVEGAQAPSPTLATAR